MLYIYRNISSATMKLIAALCCTSLLQLISLQTSASVPILSTTVVMYTTKLLKLVSSARQFKNQFLDKEKDSNAEVLQQLNSLSTDFHEARDMIMDHISNKLRDKLINKADEFFKLVKDIQLLYHHFLDVIADADRLQPSELLDFAQVATTYSLVEIRTTIIKMHAALADLDIRKESLINIIAKESTVGLELAFRTIFDNAIINILM